MPLHCARVVIAAGLQIVIFYLECQDGVVIPVRWGEGRGGGEGRGRGRGRGGGGGG